ncbi:hypothetical protein CMEL01_03193 [Colletotrichum melonis]|uniref:Uncharacterized protein n=1 Tax=Colletotrichum melonis TaxID=1209925 RepID=A0AAI9XU26_9PEZI|nr:hypothetical protein CMEL01_03193 [Colletotrichum melonis]
MGGTTALLYLLYDKQVVATHLDASKSTLPSQSAPSHPKATAKHFQRRERANSLHNDREEALQRIRNPIRVARDGITLRYIQRVRNGPHDPRHRQRREPDLGAPHQIPHESDPETRLRRRRPRFRERAEEEVCAHAFRHGERAKVANVQAVDEALQAAVGAEDVLDAEDDDEDADDEDGEEGEPEDRGEDFAAGAASRRRGDDGNDGDLGEGCDTDDEEAEKYVERPDGA